MFNRDRHEWHPVYKTISEWLAAEARPVPQAERARTVRRRLVRTRR